MGVRHTFYTDNAARDYAYKLRMAGHANTRAAIIAEAMLGGVGAMPHGLTAVYTYAIADSVDYNTNNAVRGVILDINYLLFFSCKPR